MTSTMMRDCTALHATQGLLPCRARARGEQGAAGVRQVRSRWDWLRWRTAWEEPIRDHPDELRGLLGQDKYGAVHARVRCFG